MIKLLILCVFPLIITIIIEVVLICILVVSVIVIAMNVINFSLRVVLLLSLLHISLLILLLLISPLILTPKMPIHLLHIPHPQHLVNNLQTPLRLLTPLSTIHILIHHYICQHISHHATTKLTATMLEVVD